MLKLNNKGTTLIELIISILLISVVIIFMFQLLLDLNNEQENNNFAIDNQVNRAEITRFISDDFLTRVITSITDNSPNNSLLRFTITYKDNTTTIIEAAQNYIQVKNALGTTRRWDILNATLYPNLVHIYKYYENTNPQIYSLIMDIEIHTINEENMVGNNNVIDDISLAFIGNIRDYTPTLNCLGYCCQHSC